MALLAERQVLKSLVSAAIAACGDKDVTSSAEPFAAGMCRHFAFLFAAGRTMGAVRGQDARQNRANSLKELDPHLFLDAVIEASAVAH